MIALVTPRPTRGQGGDTVGPTKPVKVVNTAAEPVPVTGSITGDINITNTPDVNVANTVRVSDGPRQPFNRVETLSFQDGDTVTANDIFTVPDDKQLVVTYASEAITLPGGQKVNFRVNVSSGGSFVAIHQLVPVLSGPLVGGGSPAFVASEPVNFYVSAGQVLSCSAVRDSSAGFASGRCSVSGYLVDVP